MENYMNYEGIVAAMEDGDYLDEEGMTDSLLRFHELVAAAGLNADDPATYRAMMTVLAVVVTMAKDDDDDGDDSIDVLAVVDAVEVVGRLATRALRDLTHGR